MRYFLDISYFGTAFHGWQIQPNGNTVQAEMEKALSTILQSEISVTGSGRTDTGVHATQQIAHFDADLSMSSENLAYKLNSFLPKDISVNGVRPVTDEAHARFDAQKRTYHYHLNAKKSPFLHDRSYYFNQPLNVALIREGCEIIKGWQNFECFSKVHTEVNNFNCDILGIDWVQKDENHLFVVSANRFLRGMVRAIVGTLLDVGQERTSIEGLRKILESNDRQKAGRAVPAHGLFLERVEYLPEVYK